MAEKVEDLTVNYEEGGLVVTKELDKKILSKGAWATILYRCKDWDAKANDYGPDKYTIRRYQKKNGQYVQRSKFNISSKDQAMQIVQALQGWV